MRRRIRVVPIYLLLLGSILVGCTVTGQSSPQVATEEISSTVEIPTLTPKPAAIPASNLTDGCIETHNPTVDYFPTTSHFEEATGVNIAYHGHFKVISVTNPWRDAEQTFQYLLVQCGTPVPEGYDDAHVIEIPVRGVVAMSSTQLPHLDGIGALDRLVGLDSFTYASNPTVREMIEAGELVEIGSGAEVNVEAAIELSPDLVMTVGTGLPDYDTHPVLLEAGIPTVLNSAYMESTPLGRAEWLKFTAAFFNKEAAANELFDAQKQRYEELVALAAGVEERPTVLMETVHGDSWNLPGGNSYQARFLADAGAAYLWAEDTSTGRLSVDFEAVFDRAAWADFWLPMNGWQSLEEGRAEDERYAEFAAFQRGNVYNNNARLNENGGNEYWEGGVAHPEVVLADLIYIFHPELLPDHELVYFRQLPAAGE